MRILVTGASGLLGRRLVPVLLKAGHAVVATSRDPESLRFPSGVLPMGWDGKDMLQVPGKVDAIIHLMGEPIVGKRWTPARKQAILATRLESTKRIAEFIARRRPADRPQVFLCANAAGYYGINPSGLCTEQTEPGTDFLADVCRQWEAAALEAETRTVILRLGHVLSKDGGYLGEVLPLAKVGLAGPLGGGAQPMPWIHIDDVCGIVLWALSAPGVQGAYNAVAPQRIAQKDFVHALNQHTTIPNLVPVPAFALKARFGEVAEAMLGGQDIKPVRLELEGYDFGHPTIADALQDLLVPKPKRRPEARAEALAKAATLPPEGDETVDEE
ncbi:MAG: TIGR01777 family oxidoreductase [Candidatus Thermoplasmatota archaeon]